MTRPMQTAAVAKYCHISSRVWPARKSCNNWSQPLPFQYKRSLISNSDKVILPDPNPPSSLLDFGIKSLILFPATWLNLLACFVVSSTSLDSVTWGMIIFATERWSNWSVSDSWVFQGAPRFSLVIFLCLLLVTHNRWNCDLTFTV